MRFFSRSTSCSFSSNASFNSAALRSLFARGVFTIFFARTPNRSVDIVSSRFNSAGEQFTTSDVLLFPPSDSCMSRRGKKWTSFPTDGGIAGPRIIISIIAVSCGCGCGCGYSTTSHSAQCTTGTSTAAYLQQARELGVSVRHMG